MLLDRVEVSERELDLDDAQVFERVGRTGHVAVLERPEDEHDRIHLADVRQELVAETLALRCPFDQAADVDELHRRGDHVLRRTHLGELPQPVVGHLGDADVGVRRGERIGRSEGAATGE